MKYMAALLVCAGVLIRAAYAGVERAQDIEAAVEAVEIERQYSSQSSEFDEYASALLDRAAVTWSQFKLGQIPEAILLMRLHEQLRTPLRNINNAASFETKSAFSRMGPLFAAFAMRLREELLSYSVNGEARTVVPTHSGPYRVNIEPQYSNLVTLPAADRMSLIVTMARLLMLEERNRAEQTYGSDDSAKMNFTASEQEMQNERAQFVARKLSGVNAPLSFAKAGGAGTLGIWLMYLAYQLENHAHVSIGATSVISVLAVAAMGGALGLVKKHTDTNRAAEEYDEQRLQRRQAWEQCEMSRCEIVRDILMRQGGVSEQIAAAFARAMSYEGLSSASLESIANNTCEELITSARATVGGGRVVAPRDDEAMQEDESSRRGSTQAVRRNIR